MGAVVDWPVNQAVAENLMSSSTPYRFIFRASILALILFFLIGCTNFTSTSAGNPVVIAAVDTSQGEPVAAQVVEGFEDYRFPTPEIEGAPTGVAVDGSVVANGEVAVGRVSQAALAVVDTSQAQLDTSVPVVTGLAAQTEYESGTLAGDSAEQRPIPTISSDAAGNAAVLSGTGSNQSITSVDRIAFVDYLRTFRDNLRELVYLVDVAAGSGSMSCADFRTYMVALDAVPHQLNVPQDLQLATYHLQQAFDKTEFAFRGMSNYCSTIAGTINLSEVQPATAVQSMYPGGQQALNDVYEAVLWVNGDVTKVRNLYYGTRSKIASYSDMLGAATAQDCAALNAAYETIVYSPQLSLPEGQVKNTYTHYADAVNIVASGGGQLYQLCGNIINGSGDMLADTVLTDTATIVSNSLTQLDVAIAYLP